MMRCRKKRARTIPEIREFDTETVLDDEATILNDFFVPHTSHDKENPIIKVGDTFIHKDAFVYNIKQYAIKNQFETRLEHSDKEQGVQIIIAIGEYMQRNYMAATHSWWSSSPNLMSTLVPLQVVDERLQQLGYLKS
jgi:hypothetical protein